MVALGRRGNIDVHFYGVAAHDVFDGTAQTLAVKATEKSHLNRTEHSWVTLRGKINRPSC